MDKELDNCLMDDELHKRLNDIKLSDNNNPDEHDSKSNHAVESQLDGNHVDEENHPDEKCIKTNGDNLLEDDLMRKKREAVILMSLKRKADLEAKRAIKENELARKREQDAAKKELIESRKQEQKQRREAILEQYRQKKKAAEAAERDGGSSIGEKSSHGGSANNLSTMQHQQLLHQHKTVPRSSKAPQNHHVSSWTLYNGPKLFARPTTKTNLIIIQNAILKALEGAANAKTLKKMQDTINTHSKTCGHFLILFKNRQQFRGLYEYDEKQNLIKKLDGIGPKLISNEDILKYYKFDSPKRQFTEVQTKHISLTIIAFTIQENLWPKQLSSRVPQPDLVQTVNKTNGN